VDELTFLLPVLACLLSFLLLLFFFFFFFFFLMGWLVAPAPALELACALPVS